MRQALRSRRLVLLESRFPAPSCLKRKRKLPDCRFTRNCMFYPIITACFDGNARNKSCVLVDYIFHDQPNNFMARFRVSSSSLFTITFTRKYNGNINNLVCAYRMEYEMGTFLLVLSRELEEDNLKYTINIYALFFLTVQEDTYKEIKSRVAFHHA